MSRLLPFDPAARLGRPVRPSPAAQINLSALVEDLTLLALYSPYAVRWLAALARSVVVRRKLREQLKA